MEQKVGTSISAGFLIHIFDDLNKWQCLTKPNEKETQIIHQLIALVIFNHEYITSLCLFAYKLGDATTRREALRVERSIYTLRPWIRSSTLGVIYLDQNADAIRFSFVFMGRECCVTLRRCLRSLTRMNSSSSPRVKERSCKCHETDNFELRACFLSQEWQWKL